MIKKRKISLLFFLLVLFIILEPCNAATVNVSPPPSGESGDSDNYSAWVDFVPGGSSKKYQYRYKSSVSVNTTISMNAYDMEGKSIIPYDINIDPEEHTFKSGTWIGINVTETQVAGWSVDVGSFEFQEVRKKYVCKYEKETAKSCTKTKGGNESDCSSWCSFSPYYPGATVGNCSCYYQSNKAMCGSDIDEKEEEYDIDYFKGTYECPEFDDWELVDDQWLAEYLYVEGSGSNYLYNVKPQAIAATKGSALASISSPKAKVEYITNKNVYPKEIRDITISTLSDALDPDSIPHTSTGEASGYYTADYEFVMKKVCINARTSDVFYGADCDNLTKIDPNVRMMIDNGQVYDRALGKNVTYWHYFIPLNAKSNSSFWLDVVSNPGVTFGAGECESIMKTRSNYQNYISPVGGTFVGDYNDYRDERRSTDYNTLQNSGECEFTSRINFPLSQEYYREVKDEDNNLTFEGFNFYYKPIDINNLFPNGLTDINSLWKEWYDKLRNGNRVSPDLTKSFDKLSYVATITNPNAIRNYTNADGNKPLYTSWESMALNGRSSLIGDGINSIGIQRMNTNLYKVYKLGCGAKNSDPSNSMLYISECGDSS